MSEDFKTEAFRYLLGELDLQRRNVFEALLSCDPTVRETLKACADDVAKFACEIATAEAVPAMAQCTVLPYILTVAAAEPRKKPKPVPWKRFVWPAVAVLLFGYCLWQLLSSSTATQLNASPVVVTKTTRSTPWIAPREGLAKPAEVTKEAEPQLAAAKTPDLGVAEEMRRLEKLRAEYADLERARDALQQEYDNILRQLALIGRDVGRLTAIELVDGDRYSRGERKGLVDIARNISTEPGIVAVTPTIPADELQNNNSSTTNSGTGSNNSSSTGTNPTTASSEPPYAWSVYDESSGRGFLTLYNLPATMADQSLQLWVKQTNSDAYQNVGTVPTQYYGGSGSLYYNVPGMTQPPAEILISEEPRAKVPTQPSGPTVLRGP